MNRVEVKKAAKERESRPGEREIWIKLDSFNVFARGLLIGFVTVLCVFDRQTAQVSFVSRSILRRLVRDSLLFGASERRLELIRDRTRHFSLNSKKIVELAIVAFRPNVFVCSRADQLHVDVHSICDFLNAAFEQRATPSCFPTSRKLSGALLYFEWNCGR